MDGKEEGIRGEIKRGDDEEVKNVREGGGSGGETEGKRRRLGEGG